MTTIYLIGTTSDGAARTSDEDMAHAFEQASGYHRCTQQEYLQRMREIRALDLPPEPTENIRPTCGTPMEWEDCDVCGGEGYIDIYDLNPLWYDLSNVKMLCSQCLGTGGRWICPNRHNHSTEIDTNSDRTASNPAGTTPAGTPATPLAGRQRARQRKHPL